LSRAISGAIEIAAGAALIATGAGASFGWSLVAMGAGAELSAIASLLQPNNGIATTVRQAAAPRRVIYGTQRVGAVEVFESTTGGSKDQYNMILVFTAHEITNFVNLYLDGRQVYFAGSGTGYSVRNGIGFGGGADGQNHIGPDGSTYNFANGYSGHEGVYVEARFGDQPSGDYMGSLHANDSRWGPDASGNTPSLMGCSYLYLKAEYDTNVFPSKPDARATIKGKAVYDPRTGETAYSENWALIVADIIQNTDYGLGDAVNQDQLIAAANICDEQVAFSGSGGGTEARYTCHYTWTMDKSVGNVLNDLMTGAGGRMSFIEGEWYIFPATYVAPVVSFSYANLLSKPSWSAQRKFREKINAVQGTYIAPNYPYSVAGNLYDSNGWYNGTIQNNFPYAFQPTSYPTYACDTLHGYASDQYLNEDNGIEPVQTLDFSSCLSITQAQRLAKIALLRNRQQGIGTLTMGVEALVLDPNDTFLFTFPQRGWTNKLLEVQRMDISVSNDASGVSQIQVQLTVNETDPSVYVWNSTDELTPYDVEAAPTDPGLYLTAPPTGMGLLSSAATAMVQPDGTVVPRIEVTWNTPADVRVSSIQVQYQLVGASGWTDGGTVSAASNVAYIPAIAGASYNVQIRSLRSNGGSSVWVAVNAFTASLVLSVSSQAGVGIGSLIGEAYSDGTGGIVCDPFTAQYGTNLVSIFPSGAVTITTDGTIGGAGAALAQQTNYYVYYVDNSYTGGNVTPIATLNQADYLGKLGYFLIDSIVTPYASSTGGSSNRYYPSTYSDLGTRTTTSPTSAFDGDTTTFASVSGAATPTPRGNGEQTIDDPTITIGDCIWQGDPAISLPAASTLTVIAGVSMLGTQGTGSATITANVNGTVSTLMDVTTTTPNATYTLTIPANTLLSSISVEAIADPGTGTRTVSLRVYEIYVQS
jgi:hypothetical protein